MFRKNILSMYVFYSRKIIPCIKFEESTVLGAKCHLLYQSNDKKNVNRKSVSMFSG